jgi:DNA-binding transcriptional MocR family regulator
VIAVESPTYHGQLELIESLGMLAIEVETCTEEGVEIDALQKTLDAHPVKVCMFSTTLSNPLGASMPDHKRKKLVELLDERKVVLIEDDVYGELLFDGHRPKPAEFHSHSGNVLTCGSFSKTAAPGYRIGWLLTGRFHDDIARLKRSFSCSSGLLRQVLQCNARRMTAAVASYFPPETRTSKPVGGGVLWLELPEAVDSEKLFDRVIKDGISIVPGSIFSPRNRYRNFIRLSFGHPWTPAIDAGLQQLGRTVSELAALSH